MRRLHLSLPLLLAAEPTKFDLGEGGYAFGSGSMSRAAIVSKGRCTRRT